MGLLFYQMQNWRAFAVGKMSNTYGLLPLLQLWGRSVLPMLLLLLLCAATGVSADKSQGTGVGADASSAKSKPPNILMILADDLGWGDTSVFPFVGNGVKTPNLEAMAARGTVLTNFHTAATVCTPTRASILTGMNPWRFGIKGVYEYGERGRSNRDDWLPQVPTAATAFRTGNYTTSHSGKWHLGGMRNDDYDLRTLPDKAGEGGQGVEKGSRRCPHPGPIQQGFEEYVSVLDGPGSPRQNALQNGNSMQSQGCTALLHNDRPLGPDGGFPQGKNPSGDEAKMTLSDCEAAHAVRMMKASVAAGKPFYQQLWFHAPHGPWEYLSGFESFYPPPPPEKLSTWPRCDQKAAGPLKYCVTAVANNSPACQPGGKAAGTAECDTQYKVTDRGPGDRMAQYRTMISAMDKAVGYVMQSLHDMGIERETLVIFTSDNGPEMHVGAFGVSSLPEPNPWPNWVNTGNWHSGIFSAAGLRGNKRYVYEGGLKVPCIVQWVGTVPKGRQNNAFAYTSDLLPTFLHAAGVAVPGNMRFDGMSILPELVHNYEWHDHDHDHDPHAGWAFNNASHSAGAGAMHLRRLQTPLAPAAQDMQHEHEHEHNPALEASGLANKAVLRQARRHTRRQLTERVVLWHNDFEGPRATAAHYLDFKLLLGPQDEPYEMFDLRSDPREQHNLLEGLSATDMGALAAGVPGARGAAVPAAAGQADTFLGDLAANRGQLRSKRAVHLWLFSKLYRALRDYMAHGNAGHVSYLQANPGRQYVPTIASDSHGSSREIRGVLPSTQAAQLATLIAGSCAPSHCSCARSGTDAASGLPSPPPLPVDGLGALGYIMPHHPYGFVNATALLLG